MVFQIHPILLEEFVLFDNQKTNFLLLNIKIHSEDHENKVSQSTLTFSPYVDRTIEWYERKFQVF